MRIPPQILTTFGATSVQGTADPSCPDSTPYKFGKLLIVIFPWCLIFSMGLASVFTFVAATGFKSRYQKIRSQIDTLFKDLGDSGTHAPLEGDDLILLRARKNNHEADVVEVIAENKHMPVPFHGLRGYSLKWKLPEYLNLLAIEKSDARVVSGRLAGALGGAFAGGILAYGRLIQFFASSIA